MGRPAAPRAKALVRGRQTNATPADEPTHEACRGSTIRSRGELKPATHLIVRSPRSPKAIEEAAALPARSCGLHADRHRHLARVNRRLRLRCGGRPGDRRGREKRIRGAAARLANVLGGSLRHNQIRLESCANCTVRRHQHRQPERFLAGNSRRGWWPTVSGPVVGLTAIDSAADSASPVYARQRQTRRSIASRENAGMAPSAAVPDRFSLCGARMCERDAQRRVNIASPKARSSTALVNGAGRNRDRVRAGWSRARLAAAGVLRVPGADGTGKDGQALPWRPRYRPRRRGGFGPDPHGRSTACSSLRSPKLAASPKRTTQPQHLARHHDGSGLVGLDRIAECGQQSGRRRTA